MSTTTTGPLTDQARAIVEAVLEAIDLPHAATVEGAETRRQILTERTRHLLSCMRGLARYSDIDGLVDARLREMHERLAENPPTYLTTDEAHQRVEDGATWDEAVGS